MGVDHSWPVASGNRNGIYLQEAEFFPSNAILGIIALEVKKDLLDLL